MKVIKIFHEGDLEDTSKDQMVVVMSLKQCVQIAYGFEDAELRVEMQKAIDEAQSEWIG